MSVCLVVQYVSWSATLRCEAAANAGMSGGVGCKLTANT